MLSDLQEKNSLTRNTEKCRQKKNYFCHSLTAWKNIFLVFSTFLHPLHLYPNVLRLSLSCLHLEVKWFQMSVNLVSIFPTKISPFPLYYLFIPFFKILTSICPKLYFYSLNSCKAWLCPLSSKVLDFMIRLFVNVFTLLLLLMLHIFNLYS